MRETENTEQRLQVAAYKENTKLDSETIQTRPTSEILMGLLEMSTEKYIITTIDIRIYLLEKLFNQY